MTSHIQVGGTGGTIGVVNNNNNSVTSLNRIFNQNYEKLRGGGSSGMDHIVSGQLTNSNSSSSLDYLYQAISLIEQKNSSISGINLSNNGSGSGNSSGNSKMHSAHTNSSLSLHSHLNNLNHHQQHQFYQQQQLNLNEAKGPRLVRGNMLYQQIPNSSSACHIDTSVNCSTNPFQSVSSFNQPNQAYNESIFFNTKSSPTISTNNEIVQNSHSNCNCITKSQQQPQTFKQINHQNQRKTSPSHNAPYYNHYQYNQNQINGSNNLNCSLTPGKAATPSRLEKAKQLARNHHYLSLATSSTSSSSSSNQTYLPPSPISSTCSVSNLSSLSSSVSVSPSSLSSSPSSVFNNNNQQQQYQHQITDNATAQNMILTNLLPFYTNNDYLKNLISTVYALTSYQQLQQQQQYNEQLRSSFAKLTNPSVNSTSQRSAATFSNNTITTDVNSQVDEHFKRSLGSHYFNTIFASSASTQHAQTKTKKSTTPPTIIGKKSRLMSSSLHLTSKKSPKLMIPNHRNQHRHHHFLQQRNNTTKLSPKIKQTKLEQQQSTSSSSCSNVTTEPQEPVSSMIKDENDYDENANTTSHITELNETASLNASLVKQELYENIKKNEDDDVDLIDREEVVNDEDDEEDGEIVQEFSLTYSSTSPGTSFSSFGSERETSTDVSPKKNDLNMQHQQSLKPPPIVDTHFSKALGVETWNKLKTKRWPPLSASSPVYSSTSTSSSYPNFKCNQDEDNHGDDDDDERNAEDEIESELKREQDEKKQKEQTLLKINNESCHSLPS